MKSIFFLEFIDITNIKPYCCKLEASANCKGMNFFRSKYAFNMIISILETSQYTGKNITLQVKNGFFLKNAVLLKEHKKLKNWKF